MCWGKLRQANVTENQKKPISLPNSNHLTVFSINNYHIFYLHAGPQLLWIFHCTVKKKNCEELFKVFRVSPYIVSEIIEDLTPIHVSPSCLFSKIGVFYAGLFMCEKRHRRNIKCFKSYIAISICFSIRDIHLELVSEFPTSRFLAALKKKRLPLEVL